LTSVLERVDQTALAEAAERVRTAHDVSLPTLTLWNTSACERHLGQETPDPWCRRCAVVLRRHQRVAVSWMYLIRSGLLADPVGLGKTAMINGLIALIAQRGEMNPRRGGGRALVVCRPAALKQWHTEMSRMVPSLATEIITGSRRERADSYTLPWDVALIGHQSFLRDAEVIRNLGVHHLFVDDVDPIRNTDNKTAWAIKQMATQCPRAMLVSGTPLQKNLEELYDVFDVIGRARPLFGPKERFIRRYCRRQPVVFYVGGVRRQQMKTIGYRNIEEFKEKIAPFSLRRRPEDIDDLDLPEVVPNDVYLDLHPAQQDRLDELAAGIVRMVREGREVVTTAVASAKAHTASKICESLAIFDGVDTPQSSVKFDWIVSQLLGDWSGEEEGDFPGKAVVFIHYLDGVTALGNRLDANNIGNVRIWGKEQDPKIRGEAQERFWDDPECRVLIGTSAIEQSLNLQCAQDLVNVDRVSNPQRMNQLAGRIRRGNSRFRFVRVHNLIAAGTHEERQLVRNQTEAALASAVWNERDPIHAPLPPHQMLQLIAPSLRSVRVA
jgi:SNF2 family DNA or RNA helicase